MYDKANFKQMKPVRPREDRGRGKQCSSSDQAAQVCH